jgi:hypothetical protein
VRKTTKLDVRSSDIRQNVRNVYEMRVKKHKASDNWIISRNV